MSDTKKKAKSIEEHPNFIKYDDFMSEHTNSAKQLGLCDKGTLAWYFNGTMDGVLYDIGENNGHKGMRMYWEIMNTIRCITLPKEIKLVGFDKVKELRTAELVKLEEKICKSYKKNNPDGETRVRPEGVKVLSPEESMEWLTGIVSLRCLGVPSDNEFGEQITWGISPDDMCKYLPKKYTEPTTPLDIFKEQEKEKHDQLQSVINAEAEASSNRSIAKEKRAELKKKKTEHKVSKKEGSTADADDLADWIEGKTSKKPKDK
tara:strand:+ start:48 stop:830 length:783 start_codon:yes stop_codon:yes gene_type:complete